jgi:AbrB family looped-hinge helix DNA binding protein
MKRPKGPKGKYAWTVKIGEKGQFVIPKEARDIFDINPGDTLILFGDEKQGLAIPPKGMLTNLMAVMFGGSVPEDEEEE